MMPAESLLPNLEQPAKGETVIANDPRNFLPRLVGGETGKVEFAGTQRTNAETEGEDDRFLVHEGGRRIGRGYFSWDDWAAACADPRGR